MSMVNQADGSGGPEFKYAAMAANNPWAVSGGNGGGPTSSRGAGGGVFPTWGSGSQFIGGGSKIEMAGWGDGSGGGGGAGYNPHHVDVFGQGFMGHSAAYPAMAAAVAAAAAPPSTAVSNNNQYKLRH